ncbi:MAG: Ig-like domain-containing protein [Patescibacteria group bacterium]
MTIFSKINTNLVLAAPCGNGVCQASQNENCLTCSNDCGTCPVPTPTSQPTPIPTTSPTNPPQISATPQPSPTNTPSASITPQPSPTSSGPTPTSSPTSSIEPSNSTNNFTTEKIYYPSLSIANFPSINNTGIISGQGATSIEVGTVSRVEYSFTEGREWFSLPVNNNQFNFLIDDLSHGLYSFQFRAISDKNIFTPTNNYLKYPLAVSLIPPQVSFDQISYDETNKSKNPKISGKIATFLSEVRSLAYSLDNGNNWISLPATNNFDFKLPQLEDGNYNLIIRVLDTAGNEIFSDPLEVIIDTIPPTFGGMSLTAGRQSLDDLSSNLQIFPTNTFDVFVSLKGGVTQAEIIIGNKNFALKPKPGNRIWTAKIDNLNPGEDLLILKAKDGADNQLTKNLINLTVNQPQPIIDVETKELLQNVTATVYYFDPIKNKPTLWDATAYGQTNPQTIDNYLGMILPQGKYYIKFDHQQYPTVQTNIFELNQSTLISFPVYFKKEQNFIKKLFFKWWPQQLNLDNEDLVFKSTVSAQPVNEKDTKTSSDSFTFVDVFSKQDLNSENLQPNTLLIFLAPWTDDSLVTISYLDQYLKINEKNRSKLKIIFPHESVGSTLAFINRGRYDLPIYVDPDGTNIELFNLTYLPQAFLIDQNKQIKTTVLGKKSILELVEKVLEN